MKRRTISISICLVISITSLAFLPSLQNDFTNWDDQTYVTENIKIRELSWKNIKHIFSSTHHGVYEPLTEFSFTVEYHFFGLNPFPYHLTNLIFHLLNCLLVFWLILLLSKKAEVSFIAALFFGIHPLHVESVAWISERKDVLSAFFFLGSLIAYLFYRREKAIKYYFLSLLLFLISLLPKPQGVILPFVLILFDYFLGRKFNRKTLLEKIPFFLISIAFLTIAITGAIPAGQLIKEDLFNPLPNLMNAAYGLAFYLVKLLVPVRLSCLYPYPDTAGGTMPFLFLLSPFILTALIMAVIFSGKYTRKIIFASLFFLITVLLVLQVIPTGPAIAADRYTYIPSIGLFYLAGMGFVWLYRRKFRQPKVIKTFLSVIFILIVGLLSLLTGERCKVWKNSRTLWSDVLEKYANVAMAYYNLGDALAARGNFKEAVIHNTKALQFKPDYPEAYNNLGSALFALGKYREAIDNYTEAVRIKPDYAEAFYNLGNALGELGKIEEAIIRYQAALRFKPVYAEANYNLGNALAGQGKLEEAITYYQATLRLQPDYADAYINLGIALAEQGKFEEAITQYTEALLIDPDFAMAHNNLGVALAAQGKFGEAITHYNEALRIKPDYTSARTNLTNVLIKQGKLLEE